MLPYIFVLVAILFRFLLLADGHTFNFTPVAAALLFFGSRGPRRRMWVPVALLAVSDVVLTKLVYSYPLTVDHVITWAWYAAVVWLGTQITSLKATRIATAGLVASFSFFLISNFAVWAVWTMYPKTMAGLLECYAAGVPFFRHQLAGDLFFTALFFAIGALSEGYETARSRVSH